MNLRNVSHYTTQNPNKEHHLNKASTHPNSLYLRIMFNTHLQISSSYNTTVTEIHINYYQF
jgi:hypothetical protein